MTGVELKRFINFALGIPISKLRAECSRRFCNIRIVPEKGESFHAPLRYNYTFPPEFGQRCMGIVYKSSPSLSAQAWGGNISSTGIAMYAEQWAELAVQLFPPVAVPQGGEGGNDADRGRETAA